MGAHADRRAVEDVVRRASNLAAGYTRLHAATPPPRRRRRRRAAGRRRRPPAAWHSTPRSDAPRTERASRSPAVQGTGSAHALSRWEGASPLGGV